MSLTDLAQRTRQLKAEHPEARALDWCECAYLVLHKEFGVKPYREEIQELANAAKAGETDTKDICTDTKDFFEERDGDEELAKQRQTGGGRRVLYKWEFLGG